MTDDSPKINATDTQLKNIGRSRVTLLDVVVDGTQSASEIVFVAQRQNFQSQFVRVVVNRHGKIKGAFWTKLRKSQVVNGVLATQEIAV